MSSTMTIPTAVKVSTMSRKKSVPSFKSPKKPTVPVAPILETNTRAQIKRKEHVSKPVSLDHLANGSGNW